MKAATDLTAASWQVFSRLLDEALDLPVEQRLTWVDALSSEHDALKPALRSVLARDADVATPGWLATLPRGAGSLPAEEADFQAGTLIGPYRLLRELGVGGMGAVWLAERADGTLKRQVALKLPRASWTRGLAERMARERDILASLEHPNIARLYDAGTDAQGRPFLALEYVEGQPIDMYCREHALNTKARLTLLLQVARAVAFAHSRLVVHRDLKPSNILVTPDGQVRLLDFGIAKLMEGDRTQETQLTRLAGQALTLEYASPEQIRGEQIGTASDVYSLGVVGYELLTGVRPYKLKRGSAAELEETIAAVDAPLASTSAIDTAARKELRGDLDAILNKALKKSPNERYATVDALALDIANHVAGHRVAARPDSLAYRISRFARRHRTPLIVAVCTVAAFGLAIGVGATAVVILALLIGLGAALWQARKARDQARLARTETRRAQAVQGFMADIFRASSDHQADPVKARNATARELLDRGAARLDESLRDAPEARAEVMAVLAQIYYELRLDEQAADIEQRRVALRRQLHGRDDRRVAEALVDLANALHSTGRRQAILPALEEASRILDLSGERATPLRGKLLSKLAQRHFNISLAQSRDFAEAAVAVWQAQPAPDLDELATALQLAARARAACGELARAVVHRRASLETMLAMNETPQVDLQEGRIALAEDLAAMLRTDEALAMARLAAEAGRKALGEQDAGNIAAHARWGLLLHARGQRPLARPMLERALSNVLAHRGEDDTMYTPLVRTMAGRAWLAEGRLSDAYSMLQQAVSVYRQHYAGSAVLAFALRPLATAAAALGRFDEARAGLEESLAIAEAASTGAFQRWRFNRWHLELARVDLWEERFDAALRRMEDVVPAEPDDIPPPQPDEIERDGLAVLAYLGRGDVGTANHLLIAAAQGLTALIERARHPALEADFALAAGRLALASHDPQRARAAFERAFALRIEFDAASSPWIAEADAWLGLASLKLGDAAAAREAARRVMNRLDALPEVGAQFVRPLADLQAAIEATPTERLGGGTLPLSERH